MRRDTTPFVLHAPQKQEAVRVRNMSLVNTLTYTLPGPVVERKTFRAGLRRDVFYMLSTAEAHKTIHAIRI